MGWTWPSGAEWLAPLAPTGYEPPRSADELLHRVAVGERFFALAQLSGAMLGGAKLQGANLFGARLESASLRAAQLTRADLEFAELEGAYLRDAQLDGASLRDANLKKANLACAQLAGANLSFAQLDGALLRNARLAGADLGFVDLSRADLSNADLQGARLDGARLAGACLGGARLAGANLGGASVEGADLRGASGLLLRDTTYIRGARFSPNSNDPWSVLRRSYTGPRLLFHLLLLVAFLAPLAARTLFWTGVNDTQSTMERLKEQLADVADTHRAEAPAVAAVLDRATDVGLCLRRECREMGVWKVVLGFDRCIWAGVSALVLVLYNTIRALLTWRVGPMREEEERSGYPPAPELWSETEGPWWKRLKAYMGGYLFLFRLHQVFNVVLLFALTTLVWHLWYWMTSPVWLPV